MSTRIPGCNSFFPRQYGNHFPRQAKGIATQYKKTNMTLLESISKQFQMSLWRALVAVVLAVVIAGCSKQNKNERLFARAESYFKQGDYDKARIEYSNLVRADPLNVAAFEKLGIIWFEGGAPFRAFPYFTKVKELAPKNYEARAKLALTYLAHGHVTEARAEATAILQEAPANGEALLLLSDTVRSKEELELLNQELQKFPERETVSFHLATANAAFRKGDLAAAETAFRQALSADPKSHAAHSAMAVLYQIRKDPAQAGEEIRIAAELAPMRSMARLKYAKFKADSGATAEARALLEEMTRQVPDYFPAWDALAQIAFSEAKYDESLKWLENISSRDPANFGARLLEAQIWLAKGDVKKSIDGLERLNQTYPNVPVVKYHMARAHLQNKNAVQASAALSQAIAANPNYVEAILLLSELQLREGNAPPVVAAMQQLLRRQPDLKPAQLLLGEAYRFLGRMEEAASVIQAQIKASPQSSQPYLLMGMLMRQQNKSGEARKAFDKALELEPDNLLVFAQIVDLDLEDKNFAGALERVRVQMKKMPTSAGAQFLEARVYAAQGQWDQAEAALLKTLDLDSTFSRAYDLLISTYISANKLAPAIGQLEGLLAKNPDNARALMMTALIYDKKGDFEKAREAYEKLLAATPDFAPALNNLAYLVGERLNQLDKAYEYARKARSLQPDDASIADTFGWILYRQGDFKQALALLQESALKYPDAPEIQYHVGMAAYMMGDSTLARSALQKAAASTEEFRGKSEIAPRLALLEAGQGADATALVTELEGILKQHPKEVIVWLRLAEAYEKQGAFEKAVNACEEALRLNSKLLRAVVKLAQLHAGPLKNRTKAFELAKKARELAPDDAQAAGILGGIAYQTGNYTWAYSLLKESTRELKGDFTVLYDAAWSAYSLGKVDEAREMMEDVSKNAQEPRILQEAKSFLALAVSNDISKEALANESEAQKILKGKPDHVPALMIRAGSELQRGELTTAEKSYLDVLRIFPDFIPAQKRLASIYLVTPETRVKAYEFAMKARKATEGDAELARILGEISFHRNEFAYAVQLLEESNAQEPLDSKLLYYLGLSYQQIKQKPKSKETLEKALAAGLQEPLAADAQRVIAELDKK